MREGLKRVENGKFNPAKSGGIGLKRVESPLGLNPSTLPDGPTPQAELFSTRYEPMPPGPTIAVESWIARRLRRADLFAGVTTPDERRERVRRAILDGRLEMAVAGKRAGQACETWREVFERVYGEPLGRREAA